MEYANISCCLITKEKAYPEMVRASIERYPFGEFLIATDCDSPHRKQELFAKAKCDFIYYQDDDCVCPIQELVEQADPTLITCAMKKEHLEAYKDGRIALIGWGSIFPKSAIKVLDKYRDKYGEDFLYQRETERIMTYLSYPQKRLELPIEDMPWAFGPGRLSSQPGHYDYIKMVEERCQRLLT